MKHDTHIQVQRQQLAKRLSKLEDIVHFTETLDDIVASLRQGYGLPKVFAHAFEAGMWAGSLGDDQPLIKAVNRYQGRTHTKLSEHMLRVSNRFHRQGKSEKQFLAWAVAVRILEEQIKLQADRARIEAVAGIGELAFEVPSERLFSKIECRMQDRVYKLRQLLSICSTAEDVILIFSSWIAKELATPDKRAYALLKDFKCRAEEAGNLALLFRLQNVEAEMDSLCQAAAEADPMNINAIGELAHRRFGIMTKRPGVFGLRDDALHAELNRRPRSNGGGNKRRSRNRKPAQQALRAS